MPRVVYLDCFSGASGDMILGALLDAGLPLAELRAALGSLALDGGELAAERVSRAGVAATWFRLHERGARQEAMQAQARGRRHEHEHDHGHAPPPHGHEHPHDHAHPHGHDHAHGHHHPHDHAHHPHRSLAEIGALIDGSALSPAARTRARDLFQRLAEAEAAIHQMPVERVHLHEVGALDSIVDIVGAVFGFEWLGADRIVASPLNVGSGTVTCAHGTFPVPAPATVRLLAGVPIYSAGAPVELVTPTGALLVTAFASAYGPIPPMRLTRAAYGAGSRDLPGTPNVLRLLIGEASEDAARRVLSLECEIDDMNPQIFGVLMDRLYEAGALEVFYAPVQMKKNRPGTLITVIAPPARREALSGIIFAETTTIGVRYQEIERECLEREIVSVDTPLGAVRFKIARRGGLVVNASPEFDDCARLAAARDVPVKTVQAAAMKAYLDRT